jgi:hypothetical protein
VVYIVVTAKILNDGSVREGERRQVKIWPAELNEGGLYFLSNGLPGTGQLYRVLSKVGS